MKGKYNPNVHSTLLAAVGAYLLYLAWILLDKYRSGSNEMSPFWNIAAVVFFVLGGLGTLYYALTVYRKGKQEETEKNDNEQQDNQ